MIMTREIACSHYPTVELGRAVDFLDSRRRPITASQREAGNIPYFGANGVQGYVKDFLFDEPLILLAEDGGHFGDPARGIAYEVTGKSWVNNHAHVLRAKRGVDQRYLLWVLKHYDVTPFITGTTRAKLTKGQAEKIPVPMPNTLDEQRRIAAILDKADATRRKREQALTLADDFLRSVFLEMFGDPVTNPKGFREVRLDAIADIASGLTKGRKTKEDEKLYAVPYMRVANVQDGFLDLSEIKLIDATTAEIERYALKAGDLLLTEGGDPDKLGRGSVWSNEIENCIHQNHIFRVRVRTDDIHPIILQHQVGSSRGKSYFLRAAKQTTGIASINKQQLSTYPTLIPNRDLQERYLEIIRKFGATQVKLQSASRETSDLFAALSQRAFAGDL